MGQTFYFDWEIRFMEWMQSFENPFVSAYGQAVPCLEKPLSW